LGVRGWRYCFNLVTAEKGGKKGKKKKDKKGKRRLIRIVALKNRNRPFRTKICNNAATRGGEKEKKKRVARGRGKSSKVQTEKRFVNFPWRESIITTGKQENVRWRRLEEKGKKKGRGQTDGSQKLLRGE